MFIALLGRFSLIIIANEVDTVKYLFRMYNISPGGELKLFVQNRMRGVLGSCDTGRRMMDGQLNNSSDTPQIKPGTYRLNHLSAGWRKNIEYLPKRSISLIYRWY